MLAILLCFLHSIHYFIVLLFFSPNSLLLCIIPFIQQARLTDPLPMTFIPLNILLPLLPWFFCCLSSFPAGKEPLFFLTEILASFLFELSHSLLITIDYFWLRFISYSFVRCMLQNWMLCYINLYISLRSIICTFVCSFLKDSLYFESWFNLIWCFKECVVWGKGVSQYYLKISWKLPKNIFFFFPISLGKAFYILKYILFFLHCICFVPLKQK